MLRRVGIATLSIGLAVLVSGCAAPLIGAFAIKDVLALVTLSSNVTTGKGVEEHAVGAIIGRDCRVIEGILRRDRDICEVPGSLATRQDFRGIGPILARQIEPVSSFTMVASRDRRGEGAASGGDAEMTLVSLVDYPDADNAGFGPMWKKPSAGLTGWEMLSSRQTILVKLRRPEGFVSAAYGR